MLLLNLSWIYDDLIFRYLALGDHESLVRRRTEFILILLLQGMIHFEFVYELTIGLVVMDSALDLVFAFEDYTCTKEEAENEDANGN